MKETYFLIVLLGNPYDESARAPVHDLILKLMMEEWATTTKCSVVVINDDEHTKNRVWSTSEVLVGLE